MQRSTAIRAIGLTAVASVSALALSSCILSPPPIESSAPSSAATAPGEASALPSATASESAAAEGPYPYTAVLGGGIVWNFDVTGYEELAVDDNGVSAEPGDKLVALLIDGELLSGPGDFYIDFDVAAVDPATDEQYGLDTGLSYYAPDDLVFAGDSFTQAQALVVVPSELEPTQWVVTSSAGESWEFTIE